MGWRNYKEKVRVKKKTEGFKWLNKAIDEQGPEVVDETVPYHKQNAELYFERFFNKKESAEFVRTLERYENGELGDDQLIIATSSILTHLHIEKDNGGDVPNYCVEKVNEHLNEFLDGNTEKSSDLTAYVK